MKKVLIALLLCFTCLTCYGEELDYGGGTDWEKEQHGHYTINCFACNNRAKIESLESRITELEKKVEEEEIDGIKYIKTDKNWIPDKDLSYISFLDGSVWVRTNNRLR